LLSPAFSKLREYQIASRLKRFRFLEKANVDVKRPNIDPFAALAVISFYLSFPYRLPFDFNLMMFSSQSHCLIALFPFPIANSWLYLKNRFMVHLRPGIDAALQVRFLRQVEPCLYCY
jgi:hypothetical protein